MKKFLTSTAVISLSALLGVGALVGVAGRKQALKADADTEHRIVVKVEDKLLSNWSQSNAKLSVYLWDDSSNTGWTNVVSLSSTKSLYILKHGYTWSPKHMIVSRQDSATATSTGAWGTSWNQSTDLSFNEATWIKTTDSSKWTDTERGGWTVTASVNVDGDGERVSLGVDTVILNSSNNPEVSGTARIEAGEEFKIHAGDGAQSGYYSLGAGLTGCFSGGSTTGHTEGSGTEGNIVCERGGSYTFYFDTETKKVHIEGTPDPLQHTYKLTVGSTDYPMTLNSGNEYYASGINLTRGATLSFKEDDIVVSDSTAKLVYNNNIDANKKVIFDSSNASVYVDVVDKTIWSGLPSSVAGHSGYHLIVNGSFVELTQNLEPSDPTFTEYYSAAINFAANDVITIIDLKASGTGAGTLPAEFVVSTINAGGLGDKFQYVAGTGIVAQEAVLSAVYLKLKYGADEVYFGNVSEAEAKAKEFAENFLTAINAVCDPNGVNTNIANLKNAWDAQKTAFNSLITGAQDILKDATTGDSVVAIRNFIAQYLYISEKYGSQLNTGWNFLNKVIPPASPAAQGFLLANNSTSMIPAIIIIAIVGFTAIGAVVTLKVRKHD